MTSNGPSEKYFSLDDGESTKLREYEETIQNGSNAQKLELSKALTDDSMTELKLAKYSEASTIFSDFCQAGPGSHREFWSARLPPGHPKGAVTPLDKLQVRNSFDHYLTAYYFKGYEDKIKSQPSLALALLDHACQRGSFFALSKRCERNIEILSNPEASESEIKQAIKELDSDTAHLSNLYWAPGNAIAALTYLQMGQYYAISRYREAKPNQAEEEGAIEDSTRYYLLAVNSSCYAQLLEAKSSSKELSEVLLGNKPIPEILGLEDWKAAKQFFIETMGVSEGVYAQIYLKADEKIKQVLNAKPVLAPKVLDNRS